MFCYIPEYVNNVLSRLSEAGFEAFLVGGCVRDAALGLMPHDYDIATNARPEETINIFDSYRIIETGIQHGTLTVLSEGNPIEITTYRVDGEYLDCRHPSEVTFTNNLDFDLSRRDFTVNAMAYSPIAGLRDPFGGLNDLAAGRISCVGEPSKRFSEDGLRILRALRFASVLDFSISDTTSDAVRAMFDLLRGISRERIDSELRRLICGVGASRIMAQYPEIIAGCLGVSEDSVVRLSGALSYLEADPVERFAALAILSDPDDPGKEAQRILTGLKASSADTRCASTLALEAARELPLDRAGILRLMGRVKMSELPAIAELRRVFCAAFDSGTVNDDADAFLALAREAADEHPCVRIDQLALDGNDVMRIANTSGKQVGDALKWLLDGVIDGHFRNDYDSLEAALRKRFSC